MPTSIRRATEQLLRPALKKIRAHAAENTRSAAPARRSTPTRGHLWHRYCHAMITSQQRMGPDFWQRLWNDSRWNDLTSPSRDRAPREDGIATLLGDLEVRFHAQKAQRIRTAWDRDIDGLARLALATLANFHDLDRPHEELRQVELLLARRVGETFVNCGVGPKIARLILAWDSWSDESGREFQHVVPIDSRWIAALANKGASLSASQITSEGQYREIEDEICLAAYDLGVLPVHADGAVFGWIGGDEYV